LNQLINLRPKFGHSLWILGVSFFDHYRDAHRKMGENLPSYHVETVTPLPLFLSGLLLKERATIELLKNLAEGGEDDFCFLRWSLAGDTKSLLLLH